MKKLSINKKMFEIHKPSSQVSCVYEKNGKNWCITPTQHDSMNYICYIAREQVFKNNFDVLELFKNKDTVDEGFVKLRSIPIKIDLRSLTKFINKFENDKKKVYHLIKELEDIKVTVGHFKGDDLMVEDRFSLISRSSRITNSNIITIYLEPELILGWLFKAHPFAKMHLKIQTYLKRTYSKILYEICKDYLTLGKIKKDFTLWKQVLGIEAPNVSKLKGNYLKNAVKEINEKTDIKITNIYGKKKNGKTTMTVEFQKQSDDKLELLGLIKEPITSLPFYNKSKSKLDNLIKNGYKVIDEDMWIQTDIKKNEEKYDAEVRIDKWLKETDQETQNDIYKILADSLDECDDPMIIIEEYRIVGLFTKETFTKNPKETIDKLNEIIAALHEE